MIDLRPLLVALLALPFAAQAVIPETPATLLASRVAGRASDCIGAHDRDQESQMFRDGSVVYRGSNSTYWLNHPVDCPAFLSNRALTTVSSTGNLCRGDIVQVTDPSSGVFYGSCALGEFVPYRNAK